MCRNIESPTTKQVPCFHLVTSLFSFSLLLSFFLFTSLIFAYVDLMELISLAIKSLLKTFSVLQSVLLLSLLNKLNQVNQLTGHEDFY